MEGLEILQVMKPLLCMGRGWELEIAWGVHGRKAMALGIRWTSRREAGTHRKLGRAREALVQAWLAFAGAPTLAREGRQAGRPGLLGRN